jgi:ribosome-associated protein
MTQLKPLTNFLSVEGMTNAEWVLVDTGDIVIHLFKYDIRELYDLEKLWKTNPKARLHED